MDDSPLAIRPHDVQQVDPAGDVSPHRGHIVEDREHLDCVGPIPIGSTRAGLASRALDNSVLASADRALGVLLGAAKGWLIAGGLLLLCTHVGPETWLQGSMSLPFLEPVSDALGLLLKALGGR